MLEPNDKLIAAVLAAGAIAASGDPDYLKNPGLAVDLLDDFLGAVELGNKRRQNQPY